MKRNARLLAITGTALAALAVMLGYATKLEAEAAAAWSPQAAVKYLDGRDLTHTMFLRGSIKR